MRKSIILTIFLFSIFLLTGCKEVEYEMILVGSNDYVEIYEDYDIQGCTMSTDGLNIDMTIKDDPIDNNKLGTYIITYETTYKDKTYYCNRAMYVVDTTRPTATLNKGFDILTKGTQWVDEGVTVEDNYWSLEDITIVVDAEELDINSVGNYTVYYVITDGSGNVTIKTRVVQIIE